MGDPVELVAQRLVELGHPVAERRHPERRDGVEVALAVDVDELVALGPLDDDRLGCRRSAAICVKPCQTTAASRATQSSPARSGRRLAPDQPARRTFPRRLRILSTTAPAPAAAVAAARPPR